MHDPLLLHHAPPKAAPMPDGRGRRPSNGIRPARPMTAGEMPACAASRAGREDQMIGLHQVDLLEGDLVVAGTWSPWQPSSPKYCKPL